jgi:hypothetical protein
MQTSDWKKAQRIAVKGQKQIEADIRKLFGFSLIEGVKQLAHWKELHAICEKDNIRNRLYAKISILDTQLSLWRFYCELEGVADSATLLYGSYNKETGE